MLNEHPVLVPHKSSGRQMICKSLPSTQLYCCLSTTRKERERERERESKSNYFRVQALLPFTQNTDFAEPRLHRTCLRDQQPSNSSSKSNSNKSMIIKYEAYHVYVQILEQPSTLLLLLFLAPQSQKQSSQMAPFGAVICIAQHIVYMCVCVCV